jgi:hypothetical protein
MTSSGRRSLTSPLHEGVMQCKQYKHIQSEAFYGLLHDEWRPGKTQPITGPVHIGPHCALAIGPCLPYVEVIGTPVFVWPGGIPRFAVNRSKFQCKRSPHKWSSFEFIRVEYPAFPLKMGLANVAVDHRRRCNGGRVDDAGCRSAL